MPTDNSDLGSNTTVQNAKAAAELLRTVSEAANNTYLRPVAGAVMLLIDTAADVRKSKKECLRMVEQVGAIVMVLAGICLNSGSELPLSMLNNIAEFSDTLQKVLVLVRHQANKSLIKRVVRRLEYSTMLAECQEALDRATQLFKLESGIAAATALTQIHADLESRGAEYAKLILARKSSYTVTSFYSSSSSSFSGTSLLPGSPKIFYGRERELEQIVSALLQTRMPGRIAILGPGGVGKSSLALAVLYFPAVVAKFNGERHFISCESAQSAADVAGALFSHFVLDRGPSQGNTQSIVLKYLSARTTPSVIVLDNLETSWEPLGGRAEVEDFLSNLSAIDSVHLMITMRGEERPSNVLWSRPFLRPLAPLSDEAAKRVFCAMTDIDDSDGQVDELLRLTDNLPLAVTLIASSVSFEGVSEVLERWNSERMSLLSEGVDKNSNLSTSIELSLSSPRLLTIPDAILLLRLLSILPDGVTEATLKEMKLPLHNISLCRITLCRTSLAYIDRDRLKVLAPIREHIQGHHPLSPSLLSPLQDYFYKQVYLFCAKWSRVVGGSGFIQQLSSDLGNIILLLRVSFEMEKPTSTRTISCVIDLAEFTYMTLLGSEDLMKAISAAVQDLDDHNIQGRYFQNLFRIEEKDGPTEHCLQEAVKHFAAAGNLPAQARALHNLSLHYARKENRDHKKSLEMCACAVTLARRSGDHTVLSEVLQGMSTLQHCAGNLQQAWASTSLDAQAHAQVAGDLQAEYNCLLNRTSHFIAAGNYMRAFALCSDGISLAESLGTDNSRLLINARTMQADIYYRKTEYQQARSVLESIRQLFCTSTKDIAYMNLERNILAIDVAIGAPDLRHDSVLAFRSLIYDKNGEIFCDALDADIFFREGDFIQAHNLYARCLAASWGHNVETMNNCLGRLGDVAYASAQIEEAFRYHTLQFALSRKTTNHENTYQALRRLGDIFYHHGDVDTAHTLFTLSLEEFTLMDIHKAKGECLFRLGMIYKDQGYYSDASSCWQQAISLFERSSQQDGVEQCKTELAAAKIQINRQIDEDPSKILLQPMGDLEICDVD